MISRSHTSAPVSLEQIIEELSSNDVVFPFAKFGEYYAQRKRRRGPGTYATIEFRTHWYMISVCGQLKPYYRLTKPEQPKALTQALTYQELKERQMAARAELDMKSKSRIL